MVPTCCAATSAILRAGILPRVQIDVPDPGYTRAARAGANFRLAARLSLGFVAILWLIQLINSILEVGGGLLGIQPRQFAGLPGILFAPLAHGDFAHLVANTPPLVVLGTVMLTLYPKSALRVLPAVYFGTGVAVWLFGRGSTHLGASGLVYGLVAYVIVAGLIRRDRRAIAASLLVAFMYGALVWGILPLQARVSWETHLWAGSIGIAMAIALRRLDVVPRVRYSWEGNDGLGEGHCEDRVLGEPSTTPMDRDASPPEGRGLVQ